eukprot:6174686-Pleurochrysis_carterae.AAC.1
MTPEEDTVDRNTYTKNICYIASHGPVPERNDDQDFIGSARRGGDPCRVPFGIGQRIAAHEQVCEGGGVRAARFREDRKLLTDVSYLALACWGKLGAGDDGSTQAANLSVSWHASNTNILF